MPKSKKKQDGAEEVVKVEQELISLVALAIGYNELAKMASVLGEKLYYRTVCESVCDEIRARGGDVPIKQDTPQLEFSVPGHAPTLKFFDRDIELMRKYIEDHDSGTKG